MINIVQIDIFHYNDKTKKYKAFNINPTDDNDAVFVSLTAGSKQDSTRDRVVLKLDKKELAYLLLEGRKIYDNLVDKERGY